MPHIAPVEDWATDFDVLDPRYVADPFGIWDELRQRCPIAHTDRRGAPGCRPATRTSPRSPTTSSTSARVRSPSSPPGRRGRGSGQVDYDGPKLEYGLPPISADPPLHTWTRRLLLPGSRTAGWTSYVPLTRRSVPTAARRVRRGGPRRRGRRLRPADPGPGHRPHPRRVARHVRHLHRLGPRRARVRRRRRAPPSAAPRACSTTSWWQLEERREHPGDDLLSELLTHRGRRPAARRRRRARHGGARS